MNHYRYNHPTSRAFQIVTNRGSEIFSGGAEVKRTASIDAQDASGSEWGEKFLIVEQRLEFHGKRYTAKSGFAVERFLETMSLNTCTARSLISGRDPERFEVVELAKFSTGTDSGRAYYIHVITKVPNREKGEVDVVEGNYCVVTKYCAIDFCISGLILRDSNEIISVEGRLGSDFFQPLGGASPIEADVYFRIPQEQLFFTNTIRARERGQDGELPTFTEMVGPGPEDVEIRSYNWWQDIRTNTPIVWTEEA